MSWGNGPFQILERINDNDYKVGLPGEYGVTATFHISCRTRHHGGPKKYLQWKNKFLASTSFRGKYLVWGVAT